MQPGKGTTNREFIGDNRPQGAQIYYSLPGNADKVSLSVLDPNGKKIAALKAETSLGLHRATWNLRKGKQGDLVLVPAGTYQVVLSVNGAEQAQQLQVMPDPGLPPSVGVAPNQPESEDSDKEARHFAY
jgi:flagellar hook assembly protein FlgD